MIHHPNLEMKVVEVSNTKTTDTRRIISGKLGHVIRLPSIS